MTRTCFRFGDCRLDLRKRELMRGDVLVALSPPVFDAIAYLITHRERAVGRDELISAVWGVVEVKDDLLAQTLVRARRAVGDTGNVQRAIRTITRFGYRWVGLVDVEQESLPDAVHESPCENAVLQVIVEQPKKTLPRWIYAVGFLFAAAILCVGLPAAYRVVSAPGATNSTDEVFLVTPVDVAVPARETAWIRLGAMDYLATTLREQGHLRVLPSETVLALIGQHNPSPTDAAELQRLRSAAGAAYVLTPHATPTAQGWRFVLDIDHQGHRSSYAATGITPLEAAASAAGIFLGGLGLQATAHEVEPNPAVEAAQHISAALLAADLPEARRLVDQLPVALKSAPEVRLAAAKVAFRGGHIDEAQEQFALLAADTKLPMNIQVTAHIGLGAVAFRRRAFDVVENEYAAAIQLLGDHADPYLLGLAYLGRGLADSGRGRVDAALSNLGRARVEMERAGNRISIADIDVDEALVEADRGRHAEALVRLDRAIAALEAFGARDHLAEALLDKTSSQLALLDIPGALASSGRAWALSQSLENRIVVNRAAAARARALLAAGELNAVAIVLDRVDSSSGATEDPELDVLRGRLAFERGDESAARQRATDAVQRFAAPVSIPGAPADAVELALLVVDVSGDGSNSTLLERLVEALGTTSSPADEARHTTALKLARAKLSERAGDAATRAAYADACTTADRSGSADLVVAAGAAEIRYLLKRGAFDDAMNALGPLSIYTSVDYSAARMATAVFRARGERALADANAARLRNLAGERDPLRPP